MDQLIIIRILLFMAVIGIIVESIILTLSFGVINDLRDAPEYWHTKYIECSVNNE